MAEASLPSLEWLRKQLIQNQVREDTMLANRQYDKFMEGVPTGARNDKLLQLIGHLAYVGLPYDEVSMLAVALNRTYCKPPMDDREVSKIIASKIRMDARKVS